MTPRIAQPHTLAPAGIKAMMTLGASFASSGLDPALMELVMLRASQINQCAFCIEMHTTDLRKRGEPEMRLYMLNAWRESSLYSERERAALGWAETLTRLSETGAPDADYEPLKAQFSARRRWPLGRVRRSDRAGDGGGRALSGCDLGRRLCGRGCPAARPGWDHPRDAASGDLSGPAIRPVPYPRQDRRGVALASADRRLTHGTLKRPAQVRLTGAKPVSAFVQGFGRPPCAQLGRGLVGWLPKACRGGNRGGARRRADRSIAMGV